MPWLEEHHPNFKIRCTRAGSLVPDEKSHADRVRTRAALREEGGDSGTTQIAAARTVTQLSD